MSTDERDRTQPSERMMAIDRPGAAEVAKRTVIGFAALTGALALLGGLGRLVAFDGFVGDAEDDFVGWIADNRVGWLDSVATIGSTLSDTWTIIGVVVGSVSMLWASGHGRRAATVLLAVLIEFFTFLAVGAIVDRARPDVDTLHSVPSTPSFPSGHVAAAFVLYGSLALVARSLTATSVPRVVWLAPAIIATVVAASRVYEGVHYPTDVVAGFLLGVGALVAAAWATDIPRSVSAGDDRLSSSG